jgi:periplasmic protein TonB
MRPALRAACPAHAMTVATAMVHVHVTTGGRAAGAVRVRRAGDPTAMVGARVHLATLACFARRARAVPTASVSTAPAATAPAAVTRAGPWMRRAGAPCAPLGTMARCAPPAPRATGMALATTAWAAVARARATRATVPLPTAALAWPATTASPSQPLHVARVPHRAPPAAVAPLQVVCHVSPTARWQQTAPACAAAAVAVPAPVAATASPVRWSAPACAPAARRRGCSTTARA